MRVADGFHPRRFRLTGYSEWCMGLCCFWFLLGRRDKKVLGGKYLFDRPSLGKSRSESAMRNTESTRPFSQSVSFSVVSQESCFSGILSLLQVSCPFAIRWPAFCNTFLALSARIISVIVDAFNAVFCGRLFTHIGQELRKRVTPVFAYANPATTMPVIPSVILVVAPSLHFFPGTVFSRLVPATGACAVTTAGNCTLLAEVGTSNNSHSATLASAVPVSQSTSHFSKLEHRQLAIDIPSLVFSALGQFGRITRRHDSTPRKLCYVRAESVNHNRLGSFHCIRQGRLVQYFP